MNTANCATCLYKVLPINGGHCYMFKREPSSRCMQWKLNKLPASVLANGAVSKSMKIG